jgi:hypothetical protein
MKPKLLDHLVGDGEQRWWYREGEHPGRKIVLHRRLHWQIVRLLAFENAIEVTTA